MRRRFAILCRNIALAGALVLALPQISRADWQAALGWCEKDAVAPTADACKTELMPDGQQRGWRTAASLVAEARQAAKRGDCRDALWWAAACRCGDRQGRSAIAANRVGVCEWLRGR